MRRVDDAPPQTTEEAFATQTVDHLKPLVRLLTKDIPMRKGELVKILTDCMRSAEKVRMLYDGLDALAQDAVREAAHDPRGQLHRDRFIARHDRMPDFHNADANKARSWYSNYDSYTRPTKLCLFFPHYREIPTDLRDLLLTFVPAPVPYALPTQDAPPAEVKQEQFSWDGTKSVKQIVAVPVRQRETAREALHDLRAILRLVESRRLRVTDKKRQPTAATIKEVKGVLQGSDFYSAEDEEEESYDIAADLTIKAFAWPMIVQAADLTQKAGDYLELTPAGRKALSQAPEQVVRAAWKKWRSSTLLDEFSRVEAIKGQGKGGLSALAARRKAVLDGLAACPPGRWFAVNDFFRFLRATGRDFELAHRLYDLYIAEHQYGNFGDGGQHDWEILQGRYILAVLFEYAATLGLIDVAYLAPQGARADFGDRWGTDDTSCLSRYDGLLYAKINPLGAWCLGLAERYELPAEPVVERLQVLANLDVVVTKPPLPAADRMLLDRFAESSSESVWRLSRDKILTALEEGFALDELTAFLASRNPNPLPQTVRVFLDDTADRAGQLRDRGTARMIECRDAALAAQLAIDPQLRGRCQLAGDRQLIFATADETAVRRSLRRLGYILPPPRG